MRGVADFFFLDLGSATGWIEMNLGLGFPCLSLGFFKIAPYLCVLWRPVFIGKNSARFSNLVPQFLLLFFFCKFNFSYFFRFFLSTSTRMRKIDDFKNNTLKVERIPKIFENLNCFEMMLKIMQIY